MVGAEPSFSEIHLHRTLYILDTDTTGRKKLVKALGLGEGSVRTIIKRLAQEGLIASTKQGHNLTPKGRQTVADNIRNLAKPVQFDLGGLVAGSQSLIVVSGGSSSTISPVSIRDAALKAGADGALIFTFDGSFKLPGIDLEKYPETLNRLKTLKIMPKDAVVVGFGSTPQNAEDGAFAAAFKLMKRVS
ncbi:MAG: DUF4443 domain-containing protein [Candidatus Altiarchaeota archaeon]